MHSGIGRKKIIQKYLIGGELYEKVLNLKKETTCREYVNNLNYSKQFLEVVKCKLGNSYFLQWFYKKKEIPRFQS